MSDIASSRQAIADELSKSAPDWHLIEKLSRDEVDSNSESVRFSVDAGHIQRLGLELVAKQETALAEIVKNAYDADATKLTITFLGHDKLDGELIIADNGVGMSLQVVRDSWMRLSTAHKQSNPISSRYGRIRAGRKGIGRFAVQRLGKQLTLETEVAGSDMGLRVFFDWDNHFCSGENLSDIFNDVEQYAKPINREGTTLHIKNLRETWSDASLNRVWKMILSLQTPFSVLTQESAQLLEYQDAGFEVELNGETTRQRKTSVGMDSGFLQHALATISGEVDENGVATVRVTSDKIGLYDSHTLDQTANLTGAFTFSARYFIYTPDALSGLSISVAREMGTEYGGIRIYRNGFRVPPYGERSDDWLRLDRDTSRRAIIVPANNVNFFGNVLLSKEANPNFEETSSREGLIENDAFEELRKIVRNCIEWAFLRVASSRGRKQTAGQKEFVSTARPRKPSEILDTLLATVETASSDTPDEATDADENSSGFSDQSRSASASEPNGPKIAATLHAIEQAKEEAKRWETEVELREAAALQYEEMLRILASLGLSISVFGHEIKGIRGSVAAHIAVLANEISALSSVNRESLSETTEGLKSITGRMFDLGGYIAGLMSNTESRELAPISLKGAIERFHKQFEHYLERQRITFTWDVMPIHLRTIEMHASELDSVLLNFLTNSIKSMKAAKVMPRLVKVSARLDGDQIVLSFEDNGLGVSEENKERIFDAFYTTSVGSDSEDSLAGPGTGLGLKIVSDIASSYGGDVTVQTPSDGYTCNIEFRVRAFGAKKEQYDL